MPTADDMMKPHKHRCMRCREEFDCRTPGICEAGYDVIPSIITMGPSGPVVTQHCARVQQAPQEAANPSTAVSLNDQDGRE